MLSTRYFAVIAIGLLMGASLAGAARARIPVIFDTDIGDDIDDTWALALIVKSPELDLKLVVGDNFKTTYRAKLLAKFLTVAERTDVPVGIGFGSAKDGGGQSKWVEGYDLKSYAGKVYDDGVQAMIDLIMASEQPITIIATGPIQNVAEALKRRPEIAKKAKFVGMHGSVRVGYDGNKKPAAEYNVKVDPKACQKAFTAPWDITITPLDTCGLVRLRGEKYAKVRDSKDPIAAAVIENYRIWSGSNVQQAKTGSSVLFDTVAVYLTFSNRELTKMEKLPIHVTDSGMTVIADGAKVIDVAAAWKDLGAYEDLLAERLTSPGNGK